MPIIHMIHGFVGAGKTTFSKKLEKETNAVRFTLDEWVIQRHGQNPPADHFQEYEKNTKIAIWEAAIKALESGNSIILDFGFWKREERNQVRKFAEEREYEVRLYNLQCPEEIYTKRVLDRTSLMPEGALFIDENAINEFKKRFEPIDSDTEQSITIKNF